MLRHELVFLPFEPLGLQYIQSILLKRGHEVELYDCLAKYPRNVRPIHNKGLFHCGSEEKKLRQQ